MLADEFTVELRSLRTEAIRQVRQRGQPVTTTLQGKGITYGQLTALPDETVDTSKVAGVDPDLRVRPLFVSGRRFSLRELTVAALRDAIELEAHDPDLATAATDVRADEQALCDRAAAVYQQSSATWRQAGWVGYNATARPYTTDEIARARYHDSTTATTAGTTGAAARSRPVTPHDQRHVSSAGEQEAVVPVVEEELQVGKRAVNRGGVRVYSRVVETPVTEHVQLRDEQVSVERRPVDRALGKTDRDAFKEKTLEVTETDEEAVVGKQAHVVEEVVVRKDVQDRTETVRDTVRRTDVDVEKVESDRR